MNTSTICLKSINDLLSDEQGNRATYWIPAYQRGYRWTELQVRQLLHDIWEFKETRLEPGKSEFYCLQPLVISGKHAGRFEVVDGQQRLTTILLILTYLNQRFSENYRKQLYLINFETRQTFDNFLESPTVEAANSNVDFFHIFQANIAIQAWFAGKEHQINDFESALLNRTKVIWFVLADGDNPVSAFTRLNVGKIPLTDDELIRALFLKRGKGNDLEEEARKLRIAYEWDLLEKALQANPFWYFLNNTGGSSRNRIRLLFELAVKQEGFQASSGHYRVFYAFSQKLAQPGKDPEAEWRRIKHIFMVLEEWYEDRTLFHIIGYLINEKNSVLEILKLASGRKKSSFVAELKAQIYQSLVSKTLNGAEPSALREAIRALLDGLSYDNQSQRQKIRSVLLLFNIASLLIDSRSNIRFQFDSYKSQNWDLEHVRSVASDRPQSPAHRQQWLKNCLDYFGDLKEHAELVEEIHRFLVLPQTDATDEVFEALDARLLEVFHESEESETEHGIGNLTLLDEGTNRGYKNTVFAMKKARLMKTDRAGIFVPLCTRNVFLKAYTAKTANPMFWAEEDRLAYQNEILETLVGFFTSETEGAR